MFTVYELTAGKWYPVRSYETLSNAIAVCESIGRRKTKVMHNGKKVA